MKLKLKKWLVRVGIALGCLLVSGFLFPDFWLGLIRPYFLGLMEVKAEEFGRLMNDVDEIEVIALVDGPLGTTGVHAEKALGYGVHGKKTLRGDEAKQVHDLWRYLRRGRTFSAMCHDPGYVLRFWKDGKLILETSVCWSCHNYTLPIWILGRPTYGFDSTREDAKELLALLRMHVPLPQKAEPASN